MTVTVAHLRRVLDDAPGNALVAVRLVSPGGASNDDATLMPDSADFSPLTEYAELIVYVTRPEAQNISRMLERNRLP